MNIRRMMTMNEFDEIMAKYDKLYDEIKNEVSKELMLKINELVELNLEVESHCNI